MPVHRKNAPPRHSHPQLVGILADELRNPSQTAGPDDPEVYEEEQPYGGNLHVTVIWSRWSGVPLEERGAIILDAYDQAGKAADLRRITKALGLTGPQAQKLGIRF